MTNKRIISKIQHLQNYNISYDEKYIFIEKLYKLANVSFSEYVKNRTNGNE